MDTDLAGLLPTSLGYLGTNCVVVKLALFNNVMLVHF
jgi:hypothetical protein